jgi:surface antigen
MVSNVNLKARIERHSRIIKNNIWNIHPFRSLYLRFNYNIVLFFVIFLFPVYPLFSSYFYDSSYYDYYIDETTIIDAYSETEEEGDMWNLLIWEDSFVSVNTLMESKRDSTWYNEIIDYKVQNGDSFSSIAAKHGVSINSILWANNFDTKKTLKPGENLTIPPVSWLIHTIKSWDNLSTIAKKYAVSEQKILEQNNLSQGAMLRKWDQIVIPGAIKKVELPKVVAKAPVKKTSASKNTPTKVVAKKSAQWGYSFTTWWSSEFIESEGAYDLVKRKPQWTFYWGNCTRYVAQYKNVNWSWNAKDWLRNAKNKGHDTGSNPTIWSIVVFQWKWYNPVYGHVWIVIDMKGDDIIVKDMNYRKLNEVTVRKVPKSDGAIRWYIYVD